MNQGSVQEVMMISKIQTIDPVKGISTIQNSVVDSSVDKKLNPNLENIMEYTMGEKLTLGLTNNAIDEAHMATLR
tara:strand:- start:52 stop:276 length:225 start_codon:yes stop_codon:yes gene_type:complete